MNENIRNALEELKRATLQVLYDQHVKGIEYSGIKEVRELLGIPPTPGANQPNDMVCHFLLFLVDEKYVDYTRKNKYQITDKGVSFIEA